MPQATAATPDDGIRGVGTGTTASGSPTGCRPGSSGWHRASGPRSSPAGCWARASSRRRNANLIGGAINGGTAQLHQQLVFRPVPGLGRAETGIPGLYLGSASAHPGGGVHGAPGANAARAAVFHDRLRAGGGDRRPTRSALRMTVDFGGPEIRFDDRLLRPRDLDRRAVPVGGRAARQAPDGPVLELCAGAGHIGLLAVALEPRPWSAWT